MKFEESLKKLEKIVQELEGGDIALDEALKKYQQGIELARLLNQKLANAKKKIDVLAKNKKGEFTLEPFDSSAAKSEDEQ